METNVEGPEQVNFSPDHAAQLWWSDCTRRPDQAPRKQYRKRALSEVESKNSSSESELGSESTLYITDICINTSSLQISNVLQIIFDKQQEATPSYS